MSKHITTDELFGKYSCFHLPAFLNKLGVTAKDFAALRIMNKPHLVKALLYHFRRHGFKPHMAHRIRHYRMTGNALNDVGMLMRLAEVNPADTSAIATSTQLFKKMHETILMSANIYDRLLPGAEKTVVQSTIVEMFSYEGTDYDAELENYSLVQCNCCHQEETVYDGNEADNAAIALADEFEHLTGPYARCNNCRHAMRPNVGPAQHLPMHAMVGQGDNDEWDLYQDHLQDCIKTMLERLSRHTGLPAPDMLHVEVKNANWRGSEAFTWCSVDGTSLAEAMSVNSDFHIADGKLIIQEDNTSTMTCLLVHHDATSRITVYPVWECNIAHEDQYLFQHQMEDAKRLADIAEILLCGEYDCHEYSALSMDRFTHISRQALAEGIRGMITTLGYGVKPEEMNALLENPSDEPALDLIIYSLFTMEDQILINKLPLNLVEMQATFTARALNDYLALEHSDAT